jgi:hypothetical protein
MAGSSGRRPRSAPFHLPSTPRTRASSSEARRFAAGSPVSGALRVTTFTIPALIGLAGWISSTFRTRSYSPMPRLVSFRNGTLTRSATGFRAALAGFYSLRAKGTEAKTTVTTPKIGFSFSMVTLYLGAGSRQRTGPFSGEGGGTRQGGGGNTRGRLPVSPLYGYHPQLPASVRLTLKGPNLSPGTKGWKVTAPLVQIQLPFI